MKTYSIKSITLAILVLTGNFIFSLTNTGIGKHKLSNDTSLCLILKGKVVKTKVNAGNTYTVELVDNSTVLQLKSIKAGAKFEFHLKKNRWYAVKIIEGGCLSKFISISTYNLPETPIREMYIVKFDLDDPLSYIEAKYLDQEAADFPLAIICYNKTIDCFDYNEEYTRNIKTELISDLEDEFTRSRSLIKYVNVYGNKPVSARSIRMEEAKFLTASESTNNEKTNTLTVPFNWSRKYCKKITSLP